MPADLGPDRTWPTWRNRWTDLANKAVGTLVMVYVAVQWATAAWTLHENTFWFSRIKEVEREISMRTENGLYYSYFKHLTSKGDLVWMLGEGVDELRRDNLTEHGNTINVFQRFNVHPELFLATVYRLANLAAAARDPPIFFYTSAVFGLLGLWIGVSYLLAWHLGGSWLTGLLSVAFMTPHRHLVSRATSAVGLRENFAMPFVYLQFTLVGLFLERCSKAGQSWLLMSIYLATVIFTLSWQFGTFILLLQAVVLFGLSVVEIVNPSSVNKVLSSNLMAVLTVWYLQFYQPMVINSLFVSFAITSMSMLHWLQTGPEISGPGSGSCRILSKTCRSLAVMSTCVLGSMALNYAVKVILDQSADSHIFEFLANKFRTVPDLTKFDSRLYLCLDAFQAQDFSFYASLASTVFVLPLYTVFVLTNCIRISLAILRLFPETMTDPGPLARKASESVLPVSPPQSDRNLLQLSSSSDALMQHRNCREQGAEPPLVRQRPMVSRPASRLETTPSSSTACKQGHQTPGEGNIRHSLFVSQEGTQAAHVEPLVAYHVCQSIVLGVLAASTRRMQCLWVPYVCILAAVSIGNRGPWAFLADLFLGTLNVVAPNKEPWSWSGPQGGDTSSPSTSSCPRQLTDDGRRSRARSSSGFLAATVTVLAILIVYRSCRQSVTSELEALSEFYNPDTVDLMEWIVEETAPDAAFSGSMQLLAGVRLSTWRPISNHPHFEDKALRDRTKEIYSIYSKSSPDEVYRVMVKYNVSYVILEDSICLAGPRSSSSQKRCSLNEIMDLSLGHIPDDGVRYPDHLVASPHPRFCDEVRHASPAYSSLFRLVFSNRTFRVYQVKPPSPTQAF